MVVFTRGSDVAAMMLLYKEMAMEAAEDLSKIARAADEGVAVDAEWVFQQYERKANGPTIFEDVLIRQGENNCGRVREQQHQGPFYQRHAQSNQGWREDRMKNIYLLAGPSGSGKSSVARELTQRYGLKEVWSYTERPPRFDGEPGHIFVTPEQFDAAGKMCAFTLYDGYRYGVPESAIEENDIYVIDPTGIRYMWERYSGSKEVVVIAIYAPQEERAERMLERGDTPEAVKERLQFDVKEFENLHIMADAWFSNRNLEETVKAVYAYMMVKERWL